MRYAKGPQKITMCLEVIMTRQVKILIALLLMSTLLIATITLFSSCENDKNDPPLSENTNNEIDPPATEDTNDKTDVAENQITVTKSSSHERVRTVHPGELITYTFTVKNAADSDTTVTITDTVPEHTVYVNGDAKMDGDALSLDITVPHGSTVTASYTVAATSNEDLCGETIVSDSAEINGKAIACDPLTIAYTFTDADQQKFAKALVALSGSQFSDYELIKYLYYVSCSTSPAITEDADAVLEQIFMNTDGTRSEIYTSIVVPGLFGGRAVTSEMKERLPGIMENAIAVEDILPGDILCVLPSVDDRASGRFYATDGHRLYDLTDNGNPLSDFSVLASLANQDLFAVLRPSIAVSSDASFRSEPLSEGQTDVEKAIIATAEAYLLRGDRMQYADIRLVQDPKVYRWERGKAPEEYTSDETGYSNCTGFVHDVFLHALGFDYGSFTLANAPESMKAYTYLFTGNETDEQKAAIETEYKSHLQIGDIVFYTYSGNTHAMLYVGNGNMLHCTGNTYKDFAEAEEPAIRYMQLDCLFDPTNSSRYLFQTAKPRTALYIIRPINQWDGTEITDAAKNRIANMQGVFAEKTCSATLGQTVNPGDTLTYTFTLFNTTDQAITLTVTDRIPENTVLLQDGASSEHRDLTWTVTLQPYEERKISYTVKVSETAEAESTILCTDSSLVGGVATKAPAVFVGRTLTAQEQAQLQTIVSASTATGDKVALANEIYEQLLGIENIFGADISALKNGIFLTSGSMKAIATEGKYGAMIAPSLYGGKAVLNSDRFLGERTRLPREKNLIVGDILYLQGSGSTFGLYIYMGEGKMLDLKTLNERDLNERLDNTIGWQMFAVLRPSPAAGE